MILPAPRHRTPRDGELVIGADTALVVSDATRAVGESLRAALVAGTGLPLPIVAEAAPGAIELALDQDLPAEGYRLVVGPHGARITGGDEAGLFHGSQTFRQLLPADTLRSAPVGTTTSWPIAAVEIDDAPTHRWRGLMLDVARRFTPVREVLRLLDLLALQHMNVLHLHLTDDQGWRLAVEKYPRLTELGSWRTESQVGADPAAPGDGRPHGGSYSAADLREIVAYAAARHIAVVPEIETPGHARAALAGHPELGVTGEPQTVWTRWGISEDVFNVEETTVAFLCDVLDEVVRIFPGPVVGVGGDECPKRQWHDDPRTQERMRELGVADEEALQAWFVGRLEEHLRAAGRRAIGWDEILEGGTVSTDAIVLSWRGMHGAAVAARRGHDVVSCPDDQVYLDYRQSEDADEPIPVSIPLTWRDVYAFDPVPPGLTQEEQGRILGGQANLWTEHVDGPRRADYLLFPRLSAMAEALWLGPDRDADDFEARLPAWLETLDALGVEYRPTAGPHPWQLVPGVAGRPASRADRDAYIAGITANITR